MENKTKVIRTQDGSDSLYNPSINESYHSKHGAIQESKHVFILNGLQNFLLNQPQTDIVNILEIGLGTGLNALLTNIFAEEHNQEILYHGLEAFPVPHHLLDKLNYIEKIASESSAQFWTLIHQSEWNTVKQISPHFDLIKEHIEVQKFQPKEKYHVCYFDAFAPTKQPEIWDLSVLKKVYQSLMPDGVFVTYCAKGQFKRDLKSVGFEVESLPGPPGKREMVRGRKIS